MNKAECTQIIDRYLSNLYETLQDIYDNIIV